MELANPSTPIGGGLWFVKLDFFHWFKNTPSYFPFQTGPEEGYNTNNILSGIGLMNRVFVNGPEDQGSIPGWVIPKTQKKKKGTWCHLA